jgi:glycosyltransferase involved in cell wall biosynthesis
VLISLKILQATEFFLPGVERGIERFVYELSRGLMSAGHDVVVLTGGRGRGRVLGGVRVEYASMYGNHMTRWTSNLYDQRITFVPSGILKMCRQSPDVVHAHYFGSGYAASLLKKYDGTPYVLTVHPVPSASSLSSPIPVYRLMYKKALEGASTVISVSNYVKEQIMKDFGVDSVVIPLSVDARKFEPCQDKSSLKRSMGLADGPVVCMVSSIEDRRKRADMLVKAMPLILKSIKNTTLVLAGTAGPGMTSYLSSLAEKLGVKDRVVITGRIDDMAVKSYLALADAFVLPSKEEAGGLVVLEAMSSAAPVICPDSGGITEYIRNGHNGLLFDHNSIEDLADKVASLLRDEGMATELGANGRRTAISRYSWGSAVSDYAAIYGNAVKA